VYKQSEIDFLMKYRMLKIKLEEFRDLEVIP